MFNKKFARLLYVVTGALVFAVLVTAITVLPRKNKEVEREFVRMNGSTLSDVDMTSAVADEAMANIDVVELNQRYAEGFNREGGVTEDPSVDLKQLSGLELTERTNDGDSLNETEADHNLDSATSEVNTQQAGSQTTPEISSYTFVDTEEIDFDVEYQYSDSLPENKEEIWGSGAPGELQITYLIYKDANGNEIRREEQSRVVTKEPINRLIVIGTAKQNAATTPAPTPGTQAPTPAPTPAPTDPPTQPSKPPVSNSFAAPGSNSAAWTNLDKISGLITPMGNLNYYNFSDNGDGTITVDGYTFAYNSVSNRKVTGYDGLECCLQWGCHNPPKNHNTMSGIPAQRGLAAAAFGGLPIGTVVFVEGYGMAVIADRHGMGGELIDVCFSPGDLRDGIANPGLTYRNVYVLNY